MIMFLRKFELYRKFSIAFLGLAYYLTTIMREYKDSHGPVILDITKTPTYI